MARRVIYCVLLMEDRSDPLIYLYRVPTNWKIGMARRFIYCVPLMEDRSGS